MIIELTKEQEALLPLYRDKFLQEGLRTDSIDKERTKDIIVNVYKYLKLKPPIVLFFDSPMACVLSYGIIDKFKTNIPRAGSQLVREYDPFSEEVRQVQD